jgi:3-oxosteroid 1-dehydrogenase
LLTSRVGMGLALVTGLLKACLQADVKVKTGWHALELVRDGKRIIGLCGTYRGHTEQLPANRGVVIASGGFEWNPTLVQRFLPGPLDARVTPPTNEGDGLLMAEAVGADLAKTDMAWWWPVASGPASHLDGAKTGQLVVTERSCPHTIVVNRSGRRFTNETAHNMALALLVRHPGTVELVNYPCWSIFDARLRRQYALLFSIRPHEPDPPWLLRADSLGELAQRAGIDPQGLMETVARFNRHAVLGSDPDFSRGISAYDRHAGDEYSPHPCLGTIEQAPFYAIRIYLGSVGTKGGPRTNKHSQVCDPSGVPIPSLYAAGNAAATWLGREIIGAGVTLSLALTTGWIAGEHLGREKGRRARGALNGQATPH